VRIGFYATLRALVGEKSIELPLPGGATVRDLAHALTERYPALAEHVFDEQGELSRRVHFMLDGRNARWLPDGADTVIEPGQRVDVFPRAARG